MPNLQQLHTDCAVWTAVMRACVIDQSIGRQAGITVKTATKKNPRQSSNRTDTTRRRRTCTAVRGRAVQTAPKRSLIRSAVMKILFLSSLLHCCSSHAVHVCTRRTDPAHSEFTSLDSARQRNSTHQAALSQVCAETIRATHRSACSCRVDTYR